MVRNSVASAETERATIILQVGPSCRTRALADPCADDAASGRSGLCSRGHPVGQRLYAGRLQPGLGSGNCFGHGGWIKTAVAAEY